MRLDLPTYPKIWRHIWMIPLVKTNSFVRFLGESSAWLFLFEINWPLSAWLIIINVMSKMTFTFVLQFFSLISDGPAGVRSDYPILLAIGPSNSTKNWTIKAFPMYLILLLQLELFQLGNDRQYYTLYVFGSKVTQD